MRPTLIRILLDHPWSLWGVDPQTGLEAVGGGVVLAALCLLWLAVQWVINRRFTREDVWTMLFLIGAGLLGRSFAQSLGLTSIPVFGYGVMVMLGVLSALMFVSTRSIRIGLDPAVVQDATVWLVLAGVLGGRLAYLGQHGDRVFRPGMNLTQWLVASVNLTEGGLVLIGALVGGFTGLVLFARSRKIPILWLADLVIPAAFLGVGFGRIGCLLNGCCYGEPCSLPWAIRFPYGSGPFIHYVDKGLLERTAEWTMPLHPTQLYSAIDGFTLAAITGWFYWRRTKEGETLALACVLYAISRFSQEFLRDDEAGQLNTIFTISQFYSVGLLLAGLLLWVRIVVTGSAVRSPHELGLPAPQGHISKASA